MILEVLILVGACAVLVKSSEMLLANLTKISIMIRVSEFVTAFLLMSISTSLPELSVGVFSAIQKTPALGFGTSIGTVIVNLTLIVGIVTLISKGIKLRSTMIRKDIAYMMLCAVAPVVLMSDHLIWGLVGVQVEAGLSRIDGGILLGVYLLYISRLLSMHKNKRPPQVPVSRIDAAKYTLGFLVSIVLLLASASVTVKFADIISESMGIPKLFMGLFVLAFGTSLPELAFSTKAVLSFHQDMAIGDLVGSVITNSTLVLGVTALIYPIYGDIMTYLISCIFMLVICFIFFTFADSGREISWREGVSLICLYLFFAAAELYIKGAF